LLVKLMVNFGDPKIYQKVSNMVIYGGIVWLL